MPISEESSYREMSEALNRELRPVGIIEETLANEILRALWRLRQCSAMEAEQRDSSGSPQKSVDRDRAQAHRLLGSCLQQLRRLQAGRPNVAEADSSSESPTPRNAPCTCGSGQKFKRCCGRNAPPVFGGMHTREDRPAQSG